MRAKIISETDQLTLESRLNAFLKEVKENEWRIFDIKYDTYYTVDLDSEGYSLHSVLVLYGLKKHAA